MASAIKRPMGSILLQRQVWRGSWRENSRGRECGHFSQFFIANNKLSAFLSSACIPTGLAVTLNRLYHSFTLAVTFAAELVENTCNLRRSEGAIIAIRSASVEKNSSTYSCKQKNAHKLIIINIIQLFPCPQPSGNVACPRVHLHASHDLKIFTMVGVFLQIDACKAEKTCPDHSGWPVH